MAEPHIPVSINHLSCRICRNLLRNPATIPCGHNFCLDCIETCWADEQRNLICPECSQRFATRTNLIQTTTLAELVRDKDRSLSRKRAERESTGFMSKRGRSFDDTTRSALCWRHNKPLDVYCCTDAKIICAECTSQHKGHGFGLIKEERKRKQDELRILQTTLRGKLEVQQKQCENMKKMFEQTEKEANKTKDDCEAVIVRIIECLQRHYLSIRRLIEAQTKAAEAQINVRLQNLKTKMEEMKKMHEDLDLLAQSDDCLFFLEEWPNMQIYCEEDLLLSSTEISDDPLSPIRTSKRDVEQLWRRLEDFCDQQFPSISEPSDNDQEESVEEEEEEEEEEVGDEQQRFESIVGGSISRTNVEPTTREEFLQYACDLSLDPTTAHKDLILSAEDKEVRYSSDKSQPTAARHPERFIHRHQVLCREGLQAERCYYEVEVTGDKAEIALAYKGMDRRTKSVKSAFGANENSWSLDLANSYSVSHRSESIELTQPRSAKKVGVYLKFKEGTLSFYEVSDEMKFLYKMEAAFSQPLYPGFWLDDKCCIRICDLKQHRQ